MVERVKKSRKSDNIFSKISILPFSSVKSVRKERVTKFSPKRRGRERWAERENSRACTRSARLPTAMLFFCCHKCHVFSVRCRISMKCRGIRNFVRWSEIERWKKWEDLSVFGVVLTKDFCAKTTCCFSQNDVLFFTKRRDVFHQTTCCFSSNNVLFLIKRRVVSHKTTWCFSSNNVLFLIKRRVVSHKTTCCFSQNDVMFFIKQRVVLEMKSANSFLGTRVK